MGARRGVGAGGTQQPGVRGRKPTGAAASSPRRQRTDAAGGAVPRRHTRASRASPLLRGSRVRFRGARPLLACVAPDRGTAELCGSEALRPPPAGRRERGRHPHRRAPGRGREGRGARHCLRDGVTRAATADARAEVAREASSGLDVPCPPAQARAGHMACRGSSKRPPSPAGAGVGNTRGAEGNSWRRLQPGAREACRPRRRRAGAVQAGDGAASVSLSPA